MIKRITDPNELQTLPAHGIEAGKIRALFNAYGTEYDFCRFYRQENTFISALDGSFVVCASENVDISELAQFFGMNGFAEIFCTVEIGTALSKMLAVSSSEVNLMHFEGSTTQRNDINTTPLLSDVYSIVSEGFDIPFEPWYLDMSHRVRHGISVCCTLENKAALVIQHNINGEALISQVACGKVHRGQGIASRLVISVAAALAPSDVFVLCEAVLIPFYEKCGFRSAGKRTVITIT